MVCSLTRVLKVPLCGKARIFRALFQETFITWWWMMEGVFSESLQWVTSPSLLPCFCFSISLGYLAFCFPVFLCKSLIQLGFSCCLRGEVCFAWKKDRGMQKMMQKKVAFSFILKGLKFTCCLSQVWSSISVSEMAKCRSKIPC